MGVGCVMFAVADELSLKLGMYEYSEENSVLVKSEDFMMVVEIRTSPD